MLRILAFIRSLAKRLDARLTYGMEMHGRRLAGLSRAQPVRRGAAGRRQPLKNRALTLAVR